MLTREQKRMALAEYRLESDDAWGNTLNHHFAVAEVAYHAGADLPEWWNFRDSPVHTDPAYLQDLSSSENAEWPDSEYVHFLDAGELGIEMLIYAGNVLGRYLNRLQRAGKDY